MKDIAILCEICNDNGNFDTMWPGGDHDDAPHWGVAEIETDEDGGGEWVITWLATGLTVAQAEEHLNGLDFDGPVHLMGVGSGYPWKAPLRPWVGSSASSSKAGTPDGGYLQAARFRAGTSGRGYPKGGYPRRTYPGSRAAACRLATEPGVPPGDQAVKPGKKALEQPRQRRGGVHALSPAHRQPGRLVASAALPENLRLRVRLPGSC